MTATWTGSRTSKAHTVDEPGVAFYTHVSDQFGPFHTKVIAATASEAPHVLAALRAAAGSGGLLGREHGRLAGQVVAECETEQACQEQQGSDEPDDAGNDRQARLLMHDSEIDAER